MSRRENRNQFHAGNRNVVVLTSWNESPCDDAWTEPSRKLATAILMQAFKDLAAQQNAAGVRWHEDAIKWFRSDATAPGSLEWVCGLLSVNAGNLRKRLLPFERESSTRCLEIRFRIHF